MNEKAYKFSTRDSTEFTVEDGSGGSEYSEFQVMLQNVDYESKLGALRLEAAIFDETSGCVGPQTIELYPGDDPIIVSVIAKNEKSIINAGLTVDSEVINVTGGIEVINNGFTFLVTGDGSITYKMPSDIQ